MSDLIRKGLMPGGANLLSGAGLVDLVWRVTWAEDYFTADDELENRIANVQGYVIFVHGWTGNHTIWEDTPGMVVAENRRLVSISIDHNGFGGSVFARDTPDLEDCNPPAAMKVIEKWIDFLKIRRLPGDPNPKVINFVGHSMGGAALFYLDPMRWRYGEETRYSLAPALLLDDELHRAFFTTLGIGISIVNRIRAFELIERAIKPNMIETLCSGASEFVKQAHSLQYDQTPRGITASTFTAMGLLANREIPRKFDTFRVMLGHRDALVGLTSMLDLLCSMEFPVGNVRVVPGTHYMFSVGRDSALQHAQNRELVIEDILMLHERAYDMQKTGPRSGGSRKFA
jgi:pimeloyl-ACP methyl ester carboxylesterase